MQNTLNYNINKTLAANESRVVSTSECNTIQPTARNRIESFFNVNKK